jgi:hypothetical protein
VKDNRKPRIALAATLAIALLVAFAALGGAGIARSAISSAQYQYGKQKAAICHKGHTITVAQPAVAAHQRHGDSLGTCASAAAKVKKAKNAKAQAAKAKAEQKKAEKQQEHGAQPDKGKGGKG